jgi:tRNA G18 (ribose-2'-O)-methylase SpoU
MRHAPITDADDARLDPFRALRDSERRFLRPPPTADRRMPSFVAEGGLVVERALAAGCTPLAIAVDARAVGDLAWIDLPGLPLVVADGQLLRRISGLGVIREAVGIFARPPERDLRQVLADARRVLVLEGIVNPANLEVVIRSAAALGVDATLCDPTSADPLYRRVVRGSMGVVLTHPWARIGALPDGLGAVRDAGFAVVALVTDPAAPPLAAALAQAGPRVALVLGTEGRGISDATRAGADTLATVPMVPGVDSLNVGAAAAVACYLLGQVS